MEEVRHALVCASLSALLGGLGPAGCGGTTLGSGAGDDGGAGGTGAGSLSGLDRCETVDECVLVTTGCCGSCGAPEPSSLVAVNEKKQARYRSLIGCEGVACGACEVPPVPLGTPVVATCREHRCVVVDLRETRVAACASADECFLRVDGTCCGSCGGGAWIAVSSEPGLRELVCAAGAACPHCVQPSPPPELSVGCVENRCEVTLRDAAVIPHLVGDPEPPYVPAGTRVAELTDRQREAVCGWLESLPRPDLESCEFPDLYYSLPAASLFCRSTDASTRPRCPVTVEELGACAVAVADCATTVRAPGACAKLILPECAPDAPI